MDTIPITYPQEFIYRVIESLGPRAPSLQLPVALHVRGSIDIKRFELAAAELVARHPILCARLDMSNGDLVQRRCERKPQFEVIEMLGATSRKVDAILSARADELFDLFSECPLRISLVFTAPDEGYLLLVGHHMFIDQVGLKIIIQEYLDLYSIPLATRAGENKNAASRGYFDYAALESRMVQDGTFSTMARYWTDALANADPELRIPGRPVDPQQQSLGSIPFRIEKEPFATFHARARQLRVTPFALVTAAVFDALRKFTPQDNLLLSVVADTRGQDFRRTVGTFANLLLVSQTKRDSGMGESAVQQVFRDIMEGIVKFVPFSFFSAEVPWLRKRLDKGFSTNDVYLNYMSPTFPDEALHQLSGSEFSPFPLTCRAQSASIPYHGISLSFILTQEKDSLSGFLQYETAIVDTDMAHSIKASWIKTLTG